MQISEETSYNALRYIPDTTHFAINPEAEMEDVNSIEPLVTFLRQVRSRSREHREAMLLLASAGLAGQMIAVLRQELDSMIRVIYLLTQPLDRRALLLQQSTDGERWQHEANRAKVTDRDMVDLAVDLQGWTRMVYRFGCAFIHLSRLHDYSDRDPFQQLSDEERHDIVRYCRNYHGGPLSMTPQFVDFVPYLPSILDKIASNLECYLVRLEEGRAVTDA